MELQNILKIIKRRKGIIIWIFFVMFFTSVIGSFLVKPTYESRAKILVVGGTSDSLNALLSAIGITGNQRSQSDPTEQTIDTKSSLIVSSSLLVDLAKKLQLRDEDNNKLFTSAELVDSKLLPLFPTPYVKVEQYEKTNLLEITARSSDPVETQFIAMVVSEIFLDKSLEWLKEDYNNAGIFIDNQIETIRANYIGSLKALEDFKIREKTMDLKTETNFLINRIEDMKNNLISTKIENQSLEASVKEISKQLKEMNMYQESSREFKENPQISELQDNLNKLILEYEGKKIDYSDSHPDLVTLKSKIAKTEELLKNEVKKIFSKETYTINPTYNSLITKLADLYIELQKVMAEEKIMPEIIREYEKRLASLPEKEFKEEQLQVDVKATGELYKSILEYQNKVGVAKAMTLTDIRLIEPALRPELPVFPNIKLSVLIGIFLGLVFGFGFAFLFEYLDNTIKESDDLRDYNLPILGQPLFTGGSLMSTIDTNDPVYESYRSVLSGIHFATFEAPAKKMLITSATPKEGKTTVTANLGILYAKEGKKTLLIDADLRRPSLHNLFGVSNDTGLIDLLTDKKVTGDLIRKTDVEGLSILPSGKFFMDPGLILKSDNMHKIIAELSGMYDVILIDSAPLYIKNDALFLMKHMDYMAMVTRKNISTYQGISRVLEILRNAKIIPIGIILNDG